MFETYTEIAPQIMNEVFSRNCALRQLTELMQFTMAQNH